MDIIFHGRNWVVSSLSSRASLFSHCFCSQYIPDFGREDKCISVVSLVEVHEDLSCFGGLVFLDEVASLRENLELIFACL